VNDRSYGLILLIALRTYSPDVAALASSERGAPG
jgi:hypothetical protein